MYATFDMGSCGLSAFGLLPGRRGRAAPRCPLPAAGGSQPGRACLRSRGRPRLLYVSIPRAGLLGRGDVFEATPDNRLAWIVRGYVEENRTPKLSMTLKHWCLTIPSDLRRPRPGRQRRSVRTARVGWPGHLAGISGFRWPEVWTMTAGAVPAVGSRNGTSVRFAGRPTVLVSATTTSSR